MHDGSRGILWMLDKPQRQQISRLLQDHYDNLYEEIEYLKDGVRELQTYLDFLLAGESFSKTSEAPNNLPS